MCLLIVCLDVFQLNDPDNSGSHKVGQFMDVYLLEASLFDTHGWDSPTQVEILPSLFTQMLQKPARYASNSRGT